MEKNTEAGKMKKLSERIRDFLIVTFFIFSFFYFGIHIITGIIKWTK